MNKIKILQAPCILVNVVWLAGCATPNSIQRQPAEADEPASPVATLQDRAGSPLPPDIALNKGAGCGDWLKVTLRMESGEELVFTVDSGSPVTVLDESYESKLGKRLGTVPIGFAGRKQRESGIYETPKLFLGNTRLMTGTNVVCTPLKHDQGILGMDCLQHYCIQLDFAANKMRFLDPTQTNSTDYGKRYPLIFTRVGPQKQFIYPNIHQVGLFGNDTNLLIDTGCRIDGLTNKSEVGRIAWAWLLSFFGAGRFHSGTWDGEAYSHIKVAPVGRANVLGLRFLARHLVTLDFPNQTMYLKQTSVGPLKPKKPEKSW